MKLTSNLKATLAGVAVISATQLAVGQNQYEVPFYTDAPYFNSSLEYGSQFTLSPCGDTYTLSSLSFDYYANYALNGGLTVRIYDNDGTAGKPGTLEYTSAPQDIKLGGAELTINFAAAPINQTETFTVQFAGIGGGNAAGLVNPQVPPNIGSGPDSYWVYDGGAWSEKTLDGAHSYFTAAVNTAVNTDGVFTPEPGTYALAALGGLALLGATAQRRSRN